MIEDIIDNFQTEVENMNLYCEYVDYSLVRDLLVDCCDDFPMTCFEYTPDSDFTVDIMESKFLNDESHDGNWLIIHNNDDTIGVLNIKEHDKIIEVDVFEINVKYRKNGYGKQFINILENVSKEYFDMITLVPFDSSSTDFWEYMNYKDNGYDGWFEKNI